MVYKALSGSAPSYITAWCLERSHCFNPSSFCTLVSGTRHSVHPADPSGARQACVCLRSHFFL